MMPAAVAVTLIPLGPGLSRDFAFYDRGEYRAGSPEFTFMQGMFATRIYAIRLAQQYALLQSVKRASFF